MPKTIRHRLAPEMSNSSHAGLGKDGVAAGQPVLGETISWRKSVCDSIWLAPLPMAVSLLLVPFAALAGSSAQWARAGGTTPKVQPAPAAQGQMRAYIDPETGQMIDHPVTEEQKRAAQQGMKAPGAGVVQTFHRADGSIKYVLNGAANEDLTATIGKDGKVHFQCTDPTHNHVLDGVRAKSEADDER